MKIRSHRAPRAPSLTRLFLATAAIVASCGYVSLADAASLEPDGLALTGGQGDAVFVSGVATYWNSLCECALLKDNNFDTRLVAQVSYWHAQQHPTDHPSLWDLGLTPFLRWLPATDSS